MYTNSYIFLKKDDIIKNNNKKNSELSITINGSFDLMLKKYFSDVKLNSKATLRGFLITGEFSLEINEKIYQISFKSYKPKKDLYVDVISNIKSKKENLIIFKYINEIFTSKDNDFNKYYVAIISSDFVSEQLGEKSFKYLNIFERKFRKLMLNVYTLKYSKNYWEINKPQHIVDGIKKNANISKKDNVDKTTNYIQQAFFLLDYNSIQEMIFTKYLTNVEKEELNNILKKENDLSKLSDKEIRRIIELSSEKNDWERIFSTKINCTDFENQLDKIRIFRNDVAHCKIINPTEYNHVIKIIKDLIQSTDIALNMTTKKDFYDVLINTTTERFDSLMSAVNEAIRGIDFINFNNSMKSVAEAINGINFSNLNNSMKSAIEGITKSTIYNNPTYLQENIKNCLIAGMTDALENNNNNEIRKE